MSIGINSVCAYVQLPWSYGHILRYFMRGYHKSRNQQCKWIQTALHSWSSVIKIRNCWDWVPYRLISRQQTWHCTCYLLFRDPPTYPEDDSSFLQKTGTYPTKEAILHHIPADCNLSWLWETKTSHTEVSYSTAQQEFSVLTNCIKFTSSHTLTGIESDPLYQPA